MSVVPMLGGQGILIQMGQDSTPRVFWEGPASWRMLELLDAVRAEMLDELRQREGLAPRYAPAARRDGSTEAEVQDFGTRPAA